MKKMKKTILVIMASVLFFMQPALTSVNNKYYQDYYNNNVKVEAGAITGSLTWAAIKAAAAAAGSALAPVAVGAVSAAAIGWVVDETIGWDVIADFGQGVIDNVIGRGGTVEDIYDAETETVRLTPELVGATSKAVDSIPNSIIVDYGDWMPLPSVSLNGTNRRHWGYDIDLKVNHFDDVLIIKGEYAIDGRGFPSSTMFGASLKARYSNSNYFDAFIKENFIEVAGSAVDSGEFEVVSGRLPAGRTLEKIRLEAPISSVYGGAVSIRNVRFAYVPYTGVVPDDVVTEDLTSVKESVGATIEERNTYITNTIRGVEAIPLVDTQAVTGVTFAEMAAATTTEDLDESTANDLGVLGTLALLYNYVKSLPVRIAGALTSLFDDVISAILAVPGAITGVLDDLLIDVNALGNAIAGSIDDLLIDVNALGNSIAGSIDNLLIDVNSLANSLAISYDGLLVNLGTWSDSLINSVGSITGSVTGAITDSMADLLSGVGSITDAIAELLTSILNGVIALPTTLVNILIGDTSLVADKFGGIKLKMRDNPFTAFTSTLKDVFDMRKSIFDIRITIKGEKYPLVPIALKSGLDTARNFLTGAIILIGSTIFYTRAKGMSWWK